MQTANKPENNNKSHEAHPSLGKLCRKCQNEGANRIHKNNAGAPCCSFCYDTMTEAENNAFVDCRGFWA